MIIYRKIVCQLRGAGGDGVGGRQAEGAGEGVPVTREGQYFPSKLKRAESTLRSPLDRVKIN